jgi:hypothetical protein
MFNRSSFLSGLGPTGGGNLPTRRLWIILTLVGLAILGLVVLYALEVKQFQRTIHVGDLMAKSAGIGLVLGSVGAYFLQRFGSDTTERVQISLTVILFFVIFLPLFGHLTNRGLGSRTPEPTEFVFFAENPFAQRFGLQNGEPIEPDGYYLFVLKEGITFRFPVKESLASGLERGDTLSLGLCRGLWGYQWLPNPRSTNK